MATSNIERVGQGLDILRKGLSPYILRELKSSYKEKWWQVGVESTLSGSIGKEASAKKGTPEERFERLDVQALLVVMWESWNNVFQTQLGHTGRSYVSELREIRNKWAHQQAFSGEDAHRALDTIARLLSMIGAAEEKEVKKLAQEVLRQQFEAETQKEMKQATFVTRTGPLKNLKPWRQIATPHPDVASGRYQQTEFAADLALVADGDAEKEYQDPREFYRRTFLTEGLVQLLSRAWERLASQGGDPVVELQTNFGGGKTHSMLALFHLFSGEVKPAEIPGFETIIPESLKSGNSDLPTANRAVLVGTRLSPAEVRVKKDGTKIHTLWGEMAWQLGHSVSPKKAKEAYALVAEEDQKGISPGSAKIAQLFQAYGPALILIDEWVAYARQLYRKEGLPGGSFEANITFVQALTEATKNAPDALVVAALPASKVEVGGEGGEAALASISDVFARLKAVWKPASASESFEIVRRRLFQPLTDFAARDAVCRAFAEMYLNNKAEFPPETRETLYETRLKSAYPIHPELFDRLYEDWSTLERFQRTRGVLKLMAAVIHELWEQQDGSLLILPGTVPLNNSSVRVGLTDHLGEGWSAVIDKDIDGFQSRPLALDRENPNLGRHSAARRVARTVFIGSAPSVSSQKVRGIEEVRVKLGCVQPGEPPAVFGDALRRISEELHYLYSDASRYWFDTQITITRQAADRAAQFERKHELVEDEITQRVKDAMKKERSDFAYVHPIPAESADVPDEMACRLVILGSKAPHRARSNESKALAAAQEFLERRGNSPRIYKNMLLFLAPDADRIGELEAAVRHWLAWQSIEQDKDQLNLTQAQITQSKKQVQHFDDRVNALLMEAFCYLIVPTQEGTKPVELSASKLNGDGLLARAARKLKNEQQMILEWAPALLRMELDRWLWKDADHISLRQVWEYMAQYIYLPRLRDQDVLADAIRKGVGTFSWSDNFAYASAYNLDEARYVGLVAGQIPSLAFDGNSLLVKPGIAKHQIEADRAKETALSPDGIVPTRSASETGAAVIGLTDTSPSPIARSLRRFHGTVELDPARIGRDAGRIADEIVAHLTSLVGAKAKVTIEIDVDVPNGIPEDRVRIVSENSNTLKFKSHEFEEG
ncbi:MAG TPA: Swt1 family HEPN domain-containing protein [Candidatus Hydrogenedentes bacterium]|nr:Swt1 family HEPN domain-containing protein [Candidatus Hydrogenedentota bacterium]